MTGPTDFGHELDRIARLAGGWFDGAVVNGVEVVGTGDDPHVLVTGGTPIGSRSSGRAIWGKAEEACALKAVIRLSEYRAALEVTRQAKLAQKGGA